LKLEELIGNNKVKTIINNAISTNNILHSYMFIGTEGIGKAMFAKSFANMILCLSNDKKPCERCKPCIEFLGNSNPDFMQIEADDGKSIKIEQIRQLQQKVIEKPINSNRKVYIINNSDLMTKEAQNCLLKTLEEPPDYVVIILIVTNESKLLTTIKSRCTKIYFENLSEEELENYITEKLKVKTFNKNMLKLCNGSIGKAISIQEKAEEYKEVENLISNIEKKDIIQVWNEAELLYKAKEDIFDFLDYINIILYNKLCAENKLKYVKCIKEVEIAKKSLESNANYDMSIDILLLKIWEELNEKHHRS
jgi:DNA polymerase-3 subunit delta'